MRNPSSPPDGEKSSAKASAIGHHDGAFMTPKEFGFKVALPAAIVLAVGIGIETYVPRHESKKTPEAEVNRVSDLQRKEKDRIDAVVADEQSESASKTFD